MTALQDGDGQMRLADAGRAAGTAALVDDRETLDEAHRFAVRVAQRVVVLFEVGELAVLRNAAGCARRDQRAPIAA